MSTTLPNTFEALAKGPATCRHCQDDIPRRFYDEETQLCVGCLHRPRGYTGGDQE